MPAETPAARPSGPIVSSDTATVTDAVRVHLAVPTAVPSGRMVPITLRVENAGTRPLDLYVRGRTPTFDVIVRAGTDTVWQRLADQVIPAIVQLRVLAPGEALELSIDWDQRAQDGRLVGPGSFTVQGILLRDDPAPLTSSLVPLRISPP